MTHFAELIRGLDKDLNSITEQVRHLSDFKDESSNNLITLKNQLEHVVTDVVLLRATMEFQEKIQNARKEIEDKIQNAKTEIGDNLNTRTKITLMILSSATGVIAIIVSTLIQALR